MFQKLLWGAPKTSRTAAASPPFQKGPIKYQSPIDLRKQDITFHIKQRVETTGKNTGATLDLDHKIYVVKDKITLQVGHLQYVLQEYHFHVLQGSEHYINGKQFDAELHYVFAEEGKGGNKDDQKSCCSVCDGHQTGDQNIFVIGRVITFSSKESKEDLRKLQVHVPKSYFENDGTLTAPATEIPVNSYSPVRWVLGVKPLYMNRDNFNAANSKATRALQQLDGRLILFH